MTIPGDLDSQPDTIARFVIHKGVRLESRYRKRAEFAVMAAMVDDLERRVGTGLTQILARVFCDSKASAVYTAWTPRGNEYWADSMAEWLGYGALASFAGGHNGIEVLRLGDNEFLAEADPIWEFDGQGMAARID